MIRTLALATAYILSTVIIRYKLKDESPDAFNDAMQALTIASFSTLAWLLWSYGGGVSNWPNVLPFAVVQVFAYSIFLVSKYLGVRKIVRGIDGFVTTLATLIFMGVALFVSLPKMKGRYVEVLLAVCFGLPLVFALPSLYKKTSYGTEVTRAAAASGLVYSRGTSDMFEEVEFVHNRETGARCGVYVDKDIESKTIYVSFAGSDSKVDWLRTNFDVEAETYAMECKASEGAPVVHKGFLKAWKSIEEPVWEKISNVMLRQGGSGKVVVCGHSLGGAVATIASLDLYCKSEKNYRNSMSVITFGSPKVGNTVFRDAFAHTIPTSVRVVTVYDPVPKMTIADFVHVPTEFVLGGIALKDPHDISAYKQLLAKATR